MDLLKSIKLLDAKPHNDAANTIMYALRSWQAYQFLESDEETRILLQRANHAIIASHRKNIAHMRLYMLTVFISIETRHYDSANEMLDKAMGYKNFMKSNTPFYYGVLCFLYAYLELSQRRIRSAKKHRRALADHIKTEPPNPHYSVMQGLLHLAAEELPEAYTFLTEAFNAGCNSVFLYDGLFRYYKIASSGGLNILPVLIYAANRGANIGIIASRFSETLSAAIEANPQAGEELYAASKYPPILKDICSHRINNGDMSAKAYAFYRDAEKKQIYSPLLFNALVRAAYENKSKKINHYPLKNFLSDVDLSEVELQFAVYVYNFILTDPSFADLLPEAQNKIIKTGTRCLEEGITGREANSIYYYLWSRFRALGITGVNFEKAEKILCENLTLFELSTEENSKVRYIYITEPEKRRMEVYATDGITPVIIEAVSENAAYTCLGKAKREILNEEIEIKRLISQAGAELYLYFFQKGDRRFHLLAYLSNFYLSQETPPDEAAPVFEAILAEKGITKSYKMKILVALGRLHYNAFSFEQALECFGEIDENSIDDDFIEQLLSIYLQTREYTRTAKLIYAKHKKIPKEVLFETVTKLLPKCDENITEIIAPIVYDLLINNFYKEDLLNFVLKNFNASYSEWAVLSQITDEDNRTAPELDARVLESALKMSSFDQHAQKAFTRLYSKGLEKDLTAQFAELATYEMLANQKRPSYDVLSILEKLFLNAEEPPVLLAWGLAGIYLHYNITTFKSQEIINYAISTLENEGILFPVFKENKLSPTPFIEKFTPFIYKTLPDKDCRLYYRIENAPSFSSVPMQYVRYGIYLAAIPMFYNETLTYYFSEELPSGSITTKEQTIKNTKAFIHENHADSYFAINNAIIYEQMFKHDKVEDLIANLVKDVQQVRAVLL